MSNELISKRSENKIVEGKQYIPIDRDILELFKSTETDYVSKINQILREYMEAHQAK